MVQLRSDAAREVLAAFGVPVELVALADGAGAREAWRRFLQGIVQPLTSQAAAALAVKLDTPALAVVRRPVRLPPIGAGAGVPVSMVGRGIPVDQAATSAGLLAAD